MDAPVITTLSDFAEAAFVTAIYPNKGEDTTYPFLGLAGECGEVCEKIKKLIRDDDSQLTTERKWAITKELGDVMWYLGANLNTHAMPIDKSADLLAINAIAKDAYEGLGEAFDLAREMARVALDMAGFAGDMRDSYNNPQMYAKGSTMQLEVMGVYFGKILAGVALLARMIGTDILSVCQHNLCKLYSRRDRGTLKGDGDDR